MHQTFYPIDVNHQNNLMSSPLHGFVYFKREDLAELLLRHPGIDVNLHNREKNAVTAFALDIDYRTFLGASFPLNIEPF